MYIGSWLAWLLLLPTSLWIASLVFGILAFSAMNGVETLTVDGISTSDNELIFLFPFTMNIILNGEQSTNKANIDLRSGRSPSISSLFYP
jgi:hypothetical protein